MLRTHRLAKAVGVTAGLSALFSAGIYLAVSGGMSSAIAGTDVASASDQRQPAGSVLAILQAPQKPNDAIPQKYWESADYFGESGLDLHTTRLLGKNAAGAYWAGEDRSGNICIILEPHAGGINSACVAVEQFLSRGVASAYSVPGASAYIEGYLVPDGVVAASSQAPLRQLGTNLLVGDTRRVPANERAQILESTGTTLKLTGSAQFKIHILDTEHVGE